MNILKALKVSELRKKLAIIPAKIIIAILATVIVNWDTNINTVWANAQAEPKKFLMHLFIMYGVVSYVYIFIKIMHNWIFGIILSVGVAALVYTQASKLGGQALLIAFAIMLVGGPLLDLINLMRYKSLKNEVIKAEEDRLEESYGDGYDDGFISGMREGKRIERRRHREYEDELEDRRRSKRHARLDDRRRDYPRLEEYDDEYYEDEYDEEEYDGYSDRRGRYDEYEDDGYDYDDEYDDNRDDCYDEYDDDYPENDEYDDDEYSERSRNRKVVDGNSEDAAGFFADCKTPAAIKRRYYDLCKVYHPDAGNGSSEIFYRIKAEYDKIK